MKGIVPAEMEPDIGHKEIAIEVTTHCNSACLHCFARYGISEEASLPVDLVKEIMVEGYDAGYRHLHITGGEPLLWEGLFETIDQGFGMGYETIFMNTNGTLITQEICKRLADYPGFSISVSLDGPQEIHERIRGINSYRKAIVGVEKALNSEIKCTIFTTVTKSLLPNLPYFTNEIYNKLSGIDHHILIQLIKMTDDGFPLSDELLDPEDFIRLVRMVALLNVGGMGTIIKKNPLANVVSKFFGMPWIPRVPPLYQEGCIMVMACRDIGVVHSNRNSFGRYRTGMIRKVLDSESYQRMVGPDQTTCPSCSYLRICEENGMIRPLEGYGNSEPDKPFCMSVLEMIESDRYLL